MTHSAFLEELLRNVVRNVEHFLHDDTTVLETTLFLVRSVERRRTDHEAEARVK
jgi:hypothetical protein